MTLSKDENTAIEAIADEPMLANVEKWVAVNSGTRNIDGLATMAGMLSDAFSALPGEVELVEPDPHAAVDVAGESHPLDHGRHLHLTVRPDAPVQMLFTGHMDTVFQVDQFESVFRSALHDPFELLLPTAESMLVVTDLAPDEANAFAARVGAFLGKTSLCDAPVVHAVSGEAFSSTTKLLELVDASDTDLICTYRNLHSEAWRYPHSLGEYLDVLLQRTDVPVLVLPHPGADYMPSIYWFRPGRMRILVQIIIIIIPSL